MCPFNSRNVLSYKHPSSSGHPVCSAAAKKVMEIYERDNVVQNAAEMGSYALNRLKSECESMPCVGEIGGLGLMIGIEIVSDKANRIPFPPFPIEKSVPMGTAIQLVKKASS